MPDNSTLIDHLDNSLQGAESSEMELQIRNDPATAREWRYINLAAEAVQSAGLYEQVGSVKATWQAQSAKYDQAPEYNHTAEASKPTGAAIHSIYRNAFRIAACILILTGGAALFKYTTTSPTGIYEKYYSSYALNTSRGNGTQDAMEEAYKNKKWAAVITLFHAAKEKNNKIYFLTGMANLELKKYDQAIDKFQQVIAANIQSGGDYFQDEAEYYLAMSWLGRNDVNEALPLFEKIKADKSHLYHDVVDKMSFTDLHIAQYRNHK